MPSATVLAYYNPANSELGGTHNPNLWIPVTPIYSTGHANYDIKGSYTYSQASGLQYRITLDLSNNNTATLSAFKIVVIPPGVVIPVKSAQSLYNLSFEEVARMFNLRK